jgi:hypothetical protein
MSLLPNILEMLPDEILLEICRYLHSGDVLYSFFGLNTRLNQTVTFYRQHVSLHRTYYNQFIHIFTIILPQIDSTIRSLVIFELESPLFLAAFKNNHRYCNLEKLTLVNWTDEKLVLFIDTLHGMEHFRKLVIQALDLTESTKDRVLLKAILSANENRLTEIIFDHECDSLNLTNDEECDMTFPNIIQLDIELQTITDLFQLVQILPNVERLHTTFKRPWIKIEPTQQRFSHLKEFSVYAMSWFSTFDDLKTMIQISPVIESLSLVLVTHDFLMVDGHHVLSLLPSCLKQFNYSICYRRHNIDEDFDSAGILETWKSISISYSISESDKRIFLHTIPYAPSRLSLRSLFNKQISAEFQSQVYRKVHHLHVYDTMALAEIFSIARHCRQMLDLIVSLRTLPSSNIVVYLFH